MLALAVGNMGRIAHPNRIRNRCKGWIRNHGLMVGFSSGVAIENDGSSRYDEGDCLQGI
jgi:hypothetical protein